MATPKFLCYNLTMLWKVIQTITAAAVLFSNVRWPWATGPMVAPFCALIAAFLVTVVPISVYDLSVRAHRWHVERRSGRGLLSQKRLNNSF